MIARAAKRGVRGIRQLSIKPYDPKYRYVDTPLGQFLYTKEGADVYDESAPLAVCLHGAPGSVYDWRYLGPALAAEGWGVLRLGQAGFGECGGISGGFGGKVGISQLPFAAQSQAVLHALGLEDRARMCVVGHSIGGAVALQMAHARFREVRPRVVLLNSVGRRPHRGLGPDVLRGKVAAMACSGKLGAFLGRLFLVHGLGFTKNATVQDAVLTFRRAHGIDFPALIRAANHIAANKTPVFSAFCEDDPILEPDIPREFAALLNATTAIFPDGGHFAQKMHAETLAKEITLWEQRTKKQ